MRTETSGRRAVFETTHGKRAGVVAAEWRRDGSGHVNGRSRFPPFSNFARTIEASLCLHREVPYTVAIRLLAGGQVTRCRPYINLLAWPAHVEKMCLLNNTTARLPSCRGPAYTCTDQSTSRAPESLDLTSPSDEHVRTQHTLTAQRPHTVSQQDQNHLTCMPGGAPTHAQSNPISQQDWGTAWQAP